MRGSSTGIDGLPDVLTVKQVAVFLSVAENSVYASVRRGELPAVHLGRRILISKPALLRWLGSDATDTPQTTHEWPR